MTAPARLEFRESMGGGWRWSVWEPATGLHLASSVGLGFLATRDAAAAHHRAWVDKVRGAVERGGVRAEGLFAGFVVMGGQP